ncbi:MAG: hypothetical protein KY455_06035 [Euryarchaeota archaeon]|nr:hypothetical protein [Euryarchaeota archaeon]
MQVIPDQRPKKSSSMTVALLFLVVTGFLVQGVAGDHQPADKAGVAASDIEILSTPVIDGSSSEEALLLSTTLKSSNPTDLILAVDLECALWTDVTVIGNDDSQAVATVKIWITIDGEPITVTSSSEDDEPAKVVFCNRAYRMATTNVDDEDMQIDTYLSTRAAHGFTWVTLNVGSGTHEIEVWGQLDAEVTGTGMAKAGIGKRILVVEPVKLANDIVI